MNDRERETRIKALITERLGYERRGLDERVALVDAELKSLGHEAKKPSDRSEKRPFLSNRDKRAR